MDRLQRGKFKIPGKKFDYILTFQNTRKDYEKQLIY